jgi:peptide/nickel transport system substrate-binding protein
MKQSRNFLKTWLFFPIAIWINSCQNVDNSKFSNYFFYNEDQNITTLDPAFVKAQSEIWAVSQIFEGLVEYDDSLNVVPCLAKSWTISDDGKTYTFNLRTDVYFHKSALFKDSTRKMNAEDVVFSLSRIADPKTASPGAWIFNDKMDLRFFENSDSFELPIRAINDSTVELELTHAFSPFLGIMAMPYCSIVPKEINTNEFRNHPIGTGPFVYRKWEEEVSLLLGRNTLYYRFEGGKRLPFLDGVLIDNVKNKQTAFMKFVQGEYDFFNGIDATIKDELLSRSGRLKPKYTSQFKLFKSPFLNTEYIGFNVSPKFKNEASNNLNFRKALNFAIDREKLIGFLRNGVGIPAYYGFTPNGLPKYPYAKVQKTVFNLDSAVHYLGVSKINTKTMKPIELNTTQDYLELMVFVQKEWAKIGVPVKINVHPSSFLRQLRKDQEISCWRGSWIADYPDPENFLVCFETRNFSPNGPNYCHYSNMAYDQMVQESNQCINDTLRMQLLAKAENKMKSDLPCIVLYYDESIRMSQNWIEGLNANPINFLRLCGVKKNKK